ncbi:MAG TPA: hypothetical protein VK176_04425 [Phycisphaerales bacterium]|nr:hypothetical protein [Phycisphaerales bacterium]
MESGSVEVCGSSVHPQSPRNRTIRRSSSTLDAHGATSILDQPDP